MIINTYRLLKITKSIVSPSVDHNREVQFIKSISFYFFSSSPLLSRRRTKETERVPIILTTVAILGNKPSRIELSDEPLPVSLWLHKEFNMTNLHSDILKLLWWLCQPQLGGALSYDVSWVGAIHFFPARSGKDVS